MGLMLGEEFTEGTKLNASRFAGMLTGDTSMSSCSKGFKIMDTIYRLDAESNGSTQCRNPRGPRLSASRAKRGRY